MSPSKYPLLTELPGYTYTSRLSRSRWAWEFLRRNEGFLEAAARHDPSEISRRPACNGITLVRPRQAQLEAERWGVAFFPDVSQTGLEADVFWNGALYPRAIAVHVRPRSAGETCDIFEQSARFCRIVHLTDFAGREHCLLKTQASVVQARCEGLSLLSPEPVRMQIIIDGVREFDAKLRILNRAIEVYRETASPSRSEWTRTSRALCHALIALDCHMSGLTHFEAARLIYGSERAERDWRSPGEAMKAEMKRALRKGLFYRDGGYAELLGSAAPLSHAA